MELVLFFGAAALGFALGGMFTCILFHREIALGESLLKRERNA